MTSIHPGGTVQSDEHFVHFREVSIDVLSSRVEEVNAFILKNNVHGQYCNSHLIFTLLAFTLLTFTLLIFTLSPSPSSPSTPMLSLREQIHSRPDHTRMTPHLPRPTCITITPGCRITEVFLILPLRSGSMWSRLCPCPPTGSECDAGDCVK